MTSAPDSDVTFPRLYVRNAEKYPDKRIAIREKDFGIWQSYTWKDSLRHAQELANGLADLGLRRGDKVAIVGDNRPQLYWAILATQCLGGVPVPLYQDAIEKEMQYVVDHSEARFAIVEDQEQVDKLLPIKEQSPHLEYIIYDDPRGLKGYSESYLLSYVDVQERGRRFASKNPDYLPKMVSEGSPDDLAVICYTSGTTGMPKGVMLSHRNFIETSYRILEYERLRDDEQVLAYLPMAWVGDFFLSYALSIIGGFTVNCPESGATVMQDMREIGPTYFFAPPRIWENILTNVMIRMEDAAWIKRYLFHFFLAVASRIQNGANGNALRRPLDLLLYQLGRVLVYGPLRDNLGLRKIRTAYTAGEAIGPELFTFFRSIGVNLKQIYGMTEASVFVSVQPHDDVMPDTVGPPLPWVGVRFSDEGEVLFNGPGVFQGYYKNSEATQETIVDGWVKTGDVGFLDQNGHLKIIDRMKDVGQLSDGTMFAPKYLENKLKFSPYIKEAMTVGQDRPYVSALVNIDMEAVGNWAEKRNLMYTSYTDLAQKPQVYELIHGEMVRVNGMLAQDEQLSGARIKKFLILHKELDPDDEEITRTRKLRRRFVTQKYESLIDALYTDADSVGVEAKVTFEDGRTASIKADVTLQSVQMAQV